MEPPLPRMHENLQMAMKAIEGMPGKTRKLAGYYIDGIICVKHKLEELAIQQGYSQACKNAISTCHGECCRYHFPRNLTPADFFVAIYQMPVEKQKALSQLMSKNNKNHCPMLLETGCFFSFEQRPVTCTNAYPCFADRSYWVKKESNAIHIKKACAAISDMISSRVSV